MRTVKPKPYQQGQLDGFCGLYCIVNAVRYLGLLGSKVHGQQLMAELCAVLETQCGLEERFQDGTDPAEIVSLLKQIVEPQYGVKRIRPFHKVAARTTFTDYASVIRTFLATKNGIVLVSLGGYHDHWSLVRRVTSRSFLFYDSDGLKQLAFRNCQLTDRGTGTQRRKHGRVHILDPYDTHFLWVD